jgi:tripartite-type tricarboxylate transporter receptor subunit TctC
VHQAAAAQAQSVAWQTTMVVGTAPGGINDISARFVARYLGKYIPGNRRRKPARRRRPDFPGILSAT